MSDLYESLSHSKWDCKYRVVFIPKRPAEDPVWESAASTRGDFSCLGSAEGVPDSRRASPAGPCAHVRGDSPEALGGLRHRVPEGEECHCGGSNVWPRAELHGRAPVGSGLCR